MPQAAGRASQQAQVSPSARLCFLSSQPRTWGLAATVAGLAAIGVTAAVLLTPGESTTSSFVTEIEQPRFVEAPGDRPSRAESTDPSFVTQVEQLFLLTETALVDGELSAAETAAIRDHTAEIAASAEDSETRLETLSVEELASIAATLLAVEVRLKAYGSEGGGAGARSLASLRTASHAVQEAITISADTSDSEGNGGTGSDLPGDTDGSASGGSVGVPGSGPAEDGQGGSAGGSSGSPTDSGQDGAASGDAATSEPGIAGGDAVRDEGIADNSEPGDADAADDTINEGASDNGGASDADSDATGDSDSSRPDGGADEESADQQQASDEESALQQRESDAGGRG